MNMKRKAAVAVVLLAVLAGSAQADGWRNRDRGWNDHHYRPAPARLRGADWIAPLVVLGIAGAAVAAVVNAPAPVIVPQPQPVTVYSSPQTVYAQPQLAAPVPVYPVAPTYALPPQADVSAPAGVAYYCPAYGQYHPRVQSCPSGWQLVALPR